MKLKVVIISAGIIAIAFAGMLFCRAKELNRDFAGDEAVTADAPDEAGDQIEEAKAQSEGLQSPGQWEALSEEDRTENEEISPEDEMYWEKMDEESQEGGRTGAGDALETAPGAVVNSGETAVNPADAGILPMSGPGMILSERNAFAEMKVPTQITKIGDTYYIVDCYHNQIIYNTAPAAQLRDWKVMDGKLNQPHAIAGDGTIFMVTDTENHRVNTYQKVDGGFYLLQTFDGVGVRPHYVAYDAPTGRFYVWSSMTGQMYVYRRNQGSLEVSLENILSLDALYGKYVRSFTIVGDSILLPCVDNACIYQVSKKNFALQKTYAVPPQIAGVVQIMPISGGFVVTISTDQRYNQCAATLITTPSLDALAAGNYQDWGPKFGGDGAPYYVSQMDGIYYTAVIREKTKPCVFTFQAAGGNLSNLTEFVY